MKTVLAALIALLTATGVLTGRAASPRRASGRLSYVVESTGVEYVTAAGSTSVFPGRLNTGDRIFGRDKLVQGDTTIGYDSEACTATFDGNDLCQVVEVFTGKGDVDATWLWVGRNTSAYGPPQFSGVIDGGTGSYVDAKGEFQATVLPTGALQITTNLN